MDAGVLLLELVMQRKGMAILTAVHIDSWQTLQVNI